jgi:hypothetical protein
MNEWTFLLVPVFVLPIIALFRFIGCGITAVGRGELEPSTTQPGEPFRPGTPSGSSTVTPPFAPPESYRAHILRVGNPDVLGYWRLVDLLGPSAPPPSTASPSDAIDETFTRPAEYIHHDYSLELAAPSGTTPGSTKRIPPYFTYLQESLIYAERSSAACRRFEGGHVAVAGAGLYTGEFTIEAWIATTLLEPGYQYTLFHAYPLPRAGALADRGFRISVRGSTDPNLIGKGHWRVALGDSPEVFPNAALVPSNGPTHIALTLKSDPQPNAPKKKRARLYIDGKLVDPPGEMPVNSYTPPDPSTTLLIGLGRERIGTNEVFRYPIICRIQEVVLHQRVLLQHEIKDRVELNAKPKA